MHLLVGNVVTVVTDYTEKEYQWISDTLTYSQYQHVAGGQGYIKNVRMFSLRKKTFPSGLLNTVYKEGIKQGFSITYKDVRKKPCEPLQDAPVDFLRDYQLEAVEAAIAQEMGILKLSTGAGKSVIAAGIVAKVPCKWGFFVHKKDLMYQTAERFKQFIGVEPGLIGDGKWEEGEQVTMCTFQTLHSALLDRGTRGAKARFFLESLEGIIIDECHSLSADTHMKVVLTCKNAFWRIGMSATPLDRKIVEKAKVTGCTGPIAYKLGAEDLIKKGVLAKPSITMKVVPQESTKKTFKGIYNQVIVNSRIRNQRVLEAVDQAQKPCLVFVNLVKHGKILEMHLRNKGVNYDYMWGDKSSSQRQDANARVARGELDVLIATDGTYKEGVDIPEVMSVVIASGKKSTIETLQRIGRGMRKAEGKESFEVYDFYDTECRMIEKHSEERKRNYEKVGFRVKVI